MSEMIERAAKAMVARRGLPDNAEINWDAFRADAEAVIRAIATPTPAMTDAAWARSIGPSEPMPMDFPRINTRIYRAMLMAAIKK